MKRHRTATAAFVTGAACLGLGLTIGAQSPSQLAVVDTAQAAFDSNVDAARELSAAFSAVAERIGPTVVNISSSRKVKSSMRDVPEGLRSPFRDFFGEDFFENFFGPGGPGRNWGDGMLQQGLGTGVIVSREGHIVTNAHVVQDADEVTVKLVDERSFTAEVVGTDPKTDIAVLKIDAGQLVVAELGNSDELKVGELIVASGNPFGLNATITSGIVSAKGRANVGIADYEDFIQTDAAINPGNSGGPLVNLDGEVVGINTAIFSRSGGSMGIGFAIPINMVKSIMTSLIEDGRVIRGWLGIAIQNLNEGLAKSFDHPSTDGVLVGDATDGGPAAKAGIRSGDIIVAFDGQEVKTVDRLRSRVADTRPGSKVEVEVVRDGRRRTIDVVVGEMEGEEEAAAAAESEEAPKLDVGMNVQALTPDLARELGYEEGTKGVVVTRVEPFGPAAKAGIRPNDVLVRVQDEDIESVADLRAQLRAHEGEGGVRLIVRSGEMQRFAFLEFEE